MIKMINKIMEQKNIKSLKSFLEKADDETIAKIKENAVSLKSKFLADADTLFTDKRNLKYHKEFIVQMFNIFNKVLLNRKMKMRDLVLAINCNKNQVYNANSLFMLCKKYKDFLDSYFYSYKYIEKRKREKNKHQSYYGFDEHKIFCLWVQNANKNNA